jgi:hypothetical protein
MKFTFQWKNDHNSFITCCGFSTDNNSKYAVSVSDIDYAIKIWDTHSGHLINEIRGKLVFTYLP